MSKISGNNDIIKCKTQNRIEFQKVTSSVSVCGWKVRWCRSRRWSQGAKGHPSDPVRPMGTGRNPLNPREATEIHGGAREVAGGRPKGPVAEGRALAGCSGP